MTFAYWCVLAALLLPYIWFTMVNVLAPKARDIKEPRDFVAHLEGGAKRAWGAQLNAFESNIGFFAAVIIAHLAHAPQGRIDLLAALFIAFRVIHGVLYLSGAGTLRSLAWLAGLICTIGLFVIGS